MIINHKDNYNQTIIKSNHQTAAPKCHPLEAAKADPGASVAASSHLMVFTTNCFTKSRRKKPSPAAPSAL
jgi:hypothetical protein